MNFPVYKGEKSFWILLGQGELYELQQCGSYFFYQNESFLVHKSGDEYSATLIE